MTIPSASGEQRQNRLERAGFRIIDLLAIAGASAVALGIVVALHVGRGVSFRMLTRDVPAITGVGVYVGFLSTLGVLIWGGALVVPLLGAAVLARRGASRFDVLFLVASAGLTGLMLVNDLYMVHDHLAPMHLGITEEFVVAAYGMVALGYLVAFRRAILGGPCLLLATALGCFGASVAVDIGDDLSGEHPVLGHILLEDGLKFVGIVCWFAFYWRLVVEALVPVERLVPVMQKESVPCCEKEIPPGSAETGSLREASGLTGSSMMRRIPHKFGPWCNGSTTGSGPVSRGSNP